MSNDGSPEQLPLAHGIDALPKFSTHDDTMVFPSAHVVVECPKVPQYTIIIAYSGKAEASWMIAMEVDALRRQVRETFYLRTLPPIILEPAREIDATTISLVADSFNNGAREVMCCGIDAATVEIEFFSKFGVILAPEYIPIVTPEEHIPILTPEHIPVSPIEISVVDEKTFGDPLMLLSSRSPSFPLFGGVVTNPVKPLLPEPAQVTVHIYDLTKLNRFLRVVGTGAFHCGVEVHWKEWSYGFTTGHNTGIFACSPGTSGEHYCQSIVMGKTVLSSIEVMQLIHMLEAEWSGSEYDMITHNCCHFCNLFCKLLGVGPIPAWTRNLASMFSGFVGVGRYFKRHRWSSVRRVTNKLVPHSSVPVSTRIKSKHSQSPLCQPTRSVVARKRLQL